MILTNIEMDNINNLIKDLDYKQKIQFYKDNNSSPFILNILHAQKLLSNPKKFGVFMEDVAQNLLDLDDSSSSEHDKRFYNKKIEIKTSTQNDKYYYQYNSIRISYDFDYLLLQNIGFDEIKYWIISKENIIKIKHLWKGQKSMVNNIITMIQFRNISKYCIEIKEKNDLIKLLK